jgi:septum formation topological specificity factor MinE
MDKKRLKLLCSGRRGILLKSLPPSIESLFSTIEKYFSINSSFIQITFKDSENDECEILDSETYNAAISEFNRTVKLSVSIFNSVPISRINPIKIPKNSATLKYVKKNSRKLALFEIESNKTQWLTFPPGITFSEYSAWVDLPSGEIFICGGGHPTSISDSFILNPYTQTFKRVADMNFPRNSHGILYVDGFVYVFGGMKNMMFLGEYLSSCERFSLETGKWQIIEPLGQPMTDISAVLMKDKILVCGKGSHFIWEIGKNPVEMSHLYDNIGSCMAVVDDMLHVIRGNKTFGCTLEYDGTLSLAWEQDITEKQSWWSHSPPLVVGRSIYFVWWQEPGWICKWDCDSKTLERVAHFG